MLPPSTGPLQAASGKTFAILRDHRFDADAKSVLLKKGGWEIGEHDDMRLGSIADEKPSHYRHCDIEDDCVGS